MLRLKFTALSDVFTYVRSCKHFTESYVVSVWKTETLE